MTTLIIILHVFVCVALILIVLLQTGKGADMGAVFGGGSSQTLFGSTGASTFLSKATTIAAVIFMLTSLVLAYITSAPKTDGSIMTREKAPVEQSVPATPAAPEASGTTPAEAPQSAAPAEAPQE
ncbi:MAG: preprotein translocase subunit SecG [Deltaproteobacteria bacterium]|nr:preprotein translocase subunit SecG [Deltaproteobacteria bacterium]MBW2042291.1 preprotein translocase subunit SecG [Deltaproteobacteria bacterium]MBW2131996.1 preprotein translocase subunit SecG [Deltaproteobacteria bacterium]